MMTRKAKQDLIDAIFQTERASFVEGEKFEEGYLARQAEIIEIIKSYQVQTPSIFRQGELERMSKCPLTNNSCEKYSCEWYMSEHDECAICTCARMIRNLKEC